MACLWRSFHAGRAVAELACNAATRWWENISVRVGGRIAGRGPAGSNPIQVPLRCTDLARRPDRSPDALFRVEHPRHGATVPVASYSTVSRSVRVSSIAVTRRSVFQSEFIGSDTATDWQSLSIVLKTSVHAAILFQSQCHLTLEFDHPRDA